MPHITKKERREERKERKKGEEVGSMVATEIARRPFRVRDFCSSTAGGMKERGRRRS